MSEMVERVAQAIAEKSGIAWTGQAVFDTLARTAVEAMREPTDGMCQRGSKTLAPDDSENFTPLPHEAGGIWSAMIDEALK